MISKASLQNLIACVEIAQKSGQIPASGMASVGIAYTQAVNTFQKMDENDSVSIVAPPEKKTDKSAEPSAVSAE